MNYSGVTALITPVMQEKSVFMVKIPEELVSSLEYYNEIASSNKPTIKLDGSSGVIKIPDEKGEKIFSFSVSSALPGRETTFCVRENGNGMLENISVMEQKIYVKPSSSSFHRTRAKIADQHKVSRCQEIETPKSFPGLNSKKLAAAKRQRVIMKDCNSSHLLKRNPVLNQGSDIVKQPLRKRIIHILAVEPCGKPEIQAKLKKNGISLIEERKIMTTLYQVASFDGAVFTLDPKLWQEIEDDWKYSTEDEAAIARLKKQKYCQTDVHKSSSQPNNINSKKRSLVDEIIENHISIPKKVKKADVKEEKLGISHLNVGSNFFPTSSFSSTSVMKKPSPHALPISSSSNLRMHDSPNVIAVAAEFNKFLRVGKEPKDAVLHPPSSNKKCKRNRNRNRRRKNNKKKRNDFNRGMEPAKAVDSQVITGTKFKVLSPVQMHIQNSYTELNNKMLNPTECSVSSKVSCKENLQLSLQENRSKLIKTHGVESSGRKFKPRVSHSCAKAFSVETKINKNVGDNKGSLQNIACSFPSPVSCKETLKISHQESTNIGEKMADVKNSVSNFKPLINQPFAKAYSGKIFNRNIVSSKGSKLKLNLIDLVNRYSRNQCSI